MNLRDLQYIVAVSDEGHFGRAAESCHVSQPTLSGQVAKLEQELGVQVFERAGRSVRPTEAGEQIIAHARRALAAASDITQCARAHADPMTGRLRIGVIPTLAPYLMPYVLPAVTDKMPNAPLSLVEDLTGNLVPLVCEGKLDAAFLATDPQVKDLASIELFDEPFWVVACANHPLAARKELKTSDLDPKNLLLLADGHCLRDQALDLCSDPHVGANMRADMRATSLETLLHMTAAGYGLTLVPQLAIEQGRAETDQLVTRPLKGKGTSRRVRLVYRRHSPRARALIELARLTRAVLPPQVRRLEKSKD